MERIDGMTLRICTACGDAVTIDEDELIYGGPEVFIVARFCRDCGFISVHEEDFLYVNHTYAFFWEDMFV